jgi:hypothetical protein
MNELFIQRKDAEMPHSQTNFPDFQALRRGLIISLGIDALLPLLLYAFLRPLLASDVVALAIAAAIPTLRILALWFFRRRVDWIGAHAVLGFSLALALTVLLVGNDFLLKVHGSLLVGIPGVVLLASVVIRKPLLEPVLRALGRTGALDSSALENTSNDPAGRMLPAGRISLITAVVGLVFFGDALAHIILALTTPTATYLALSRLVTIAILGGGAGFLAWMRLRSDSLASS